MTWATPASEAVPLARSLLSRVYGDAGRPKPFAGRSTRYLWSDAHGVLAYLSLARETGSPHFIERADAVIDDVHNTLGRDRRGGLLAPAGPLLSNGLRIGKADESGADCDGQYFHYLTKWMLALRQAALARPPSSPRRSALIDHALFLAKGVFPRFVIADVRSSRPRMFWKLSVDLKTVLVPSEGNLDPFDGLATYKLLAEVAPDKHALDYEIRALDSMVHAKLSATGPFSSSDALDLGEALQVAAWFPTEGWAASLAASSASDLERLWRSGAFDPKRPAWRRLAFREFGTTIGVQVNSEAAAAVGSGGEWGDRVRVLHSFWEPRAFDRDADITPLMFAVSLVPTALSRHFETGAPAA